MTLRRFFGLSLWLLLLACGQAQALDVTILTNTPVVARNFLVARGIIKDDGSGNYVGVKSGVEITWDSVPNRIVTTLAVGTPGQVGYMPAVMDTRKVYLVRFAQGQATDLDDDDGSATQPNDPTPRLSRSKIAKWIIANSVAVTLMSADGKTYQTRRVGMGVTAVFFVLPADAGAFGVWQ